MGIVLVEWNGRIVWLQLELSEFAHFVHYPPSRIRRCRGHDSVELFTVIDYERGLNYIAARLPSRQLVASQLMWWWFPRSSWDT